MENIKQEKENPKYARLVPLVQFEPPTLSKHQLAVDLKVEEPQDSSNMRSEFDLPSISPPKIKEIKMPESGQICSEKSLDCEKNGDEKIIEKDALSCSQCDKSFTSNRRFQAHICSVHRSYRFCDSGAEISGNLKPPMGKKGMLCDKKFNVSPSSTVIVHDRTYRGNEPFVCDDCGKGFKLKWYLERHQRIHTGEKPYKCKLCNKRFSQSNTLTVHERSHTANKPFGCSECGKTYGYKSHLNRHKLIHSGERRFSCKHCRQRFSKECLLKTHEQIHKKEKAFECRWCDKAFSQAGDRMNHERMHTGEKPYQCQMCSYRCSQFSNLRVHERTHTGEKPHKCKMCDFRCTQGSTLRAHERTHKGT